MKLLFHVTTSYLFPFIGSASEGEIFIARRSGGSEVVSKSARTLVDSVHGLDTFPVRDSISGPVGYISNAAATRKFEFRGAAPFSRPSLRAARQAR